MGGEARVECVVAYVIAKNPHAIVIKNSFVTKQSPAMAYVSNWRLLAVRFARMRLLCHAFAQRQGCHRCNDVQNVE